MTTNINTAISGVMDAFADLLREVYMESNTGLASTALQEVAIVTTALSNTISTGAAQCKVHDAEFALETTKKLLGSLGVLRSELRAAPQDGANKAAGSPSFGQSHAEQAGEVVPDEEVNRG